ncbi:uncharacterized protein [Temnothorax longispinosus]|uniref:uncharacterized protein isoform X1 n=1 Tax=Temnothorax longispinosus TaxID=300112 RepID=UPI003A9A1CAB
MFVYLPIRSPIHANPAFDSFEQRNQYIGPVYSSHVPHSTLITLPVRFLCAPRVFERSPTNALKPLFSDATDNNEKVGNFYGKNGPPTKLHVTTISATTIPLSATTTNVNAINAITTTYGAYNRNRDGLQQ